MTDTKTLPLVPGSSGGTYIPPEDTFEVLTAQPLVRFLTQAVQPPAAVYVTTQDSLRVGFFSIVDTAPTFTARILKADGAIVEMVQVMRGTGSPTFGTIALPLPEGFILSVGVTTLATQVGQMYAWADVVRGTVPNGLPARTQALFAGYATQQFPLGFPASPVRASTEGPGEIAVASFSQPVAGAEMTMVVPSGFRWRVISLSSVLNTSAVVADRYPIFEVLFQGTGRVWRTTPAGPVTGSSSVEVTAAAGAAPSTGTPFSSQASLPIGMFLGATDRINSLTVSMDPGDQWIAGLAHIERWVDG
jgi:hypothetical protein